ncbi:hypothetical protein GCM10010413_22520 [Promicromonospora sukumoe]|uniref:Uncharacterized protein n=1 Tax=Promicromonospora sukumoe TaxID=88382 RepID=A0A7W3J946_9MICO|nr:hypothetical protein [Promicromonospora sukumoe]MBA8808531.1 hypothetical protein [Promicromonospora sukumoe]
MSAARVLLAVVLLGAAALVLGPVSAGYADEGEDTGISVTIPDVDPTEEPTEEPTEDPTGEPTDDPGDPSGDPTRPGASDGNGAGGGGGAGGGVGGGGGAGGAGGGGSGGGGGDPADDDPSTPGPSGKCVPAEPVVPTEPAADGDPATLDDDVRLPGEEVVVRAKGFEDGERVQVVLFTAPQRVESTRADGRGVVEAAVTLPDEVAAGPRAVQFTGWCGQVAVAQVLVAAPGSQAGGGIPAWAWWTGGGLGAAGAGVGGWYVVRLMRAPGAGLPVAGSAGVAA